jgi:hypothetical protein
MTVDEQYDLLLKEKGKEEADKFLQAVAESGSVDDLAREQADIAYYGSLF